MGKLSWYFNRLRAMSPREIIWRLEQKRLQKRELAEFSIPRSILEPLYPAAADVKARMETVQDRQSDSNPAPEVKSILPEERIQLLGPFCYDQYATDWHAGFNTPQKWPVTPSYKLPYKQRDDIGDARINWEINRHRQFIRLATAIRDNAGDQAKVDLLTGRLATLLNDWADSNPFLHGISWTSPMEIALRSISWITAARMLPSRQYDLRRALLTGSANMTEYLTRHCSGFSSANNHLLVESAAIALAGFEFNRPDWVNSSMETLTRELPRQVAPDGVNLESSLHYHGFVLEAYLLVLQELVVTNTPVPEVWKELLPKMAEFIRASRIADGVYCVFGDDDEARILDSGTGEQNYYDYLLSFYDSLTGALTESQISLSSSFSLPSSQTDTPSAPIRHTFPYGEMMTFPAGGYTFARNGRMKVGIDHAPLGFGAIAAHGHADALSFQLYLDGRPVFIDSGTYLYHIDHRHRNSLRSSMAHNTVTINNMEQSQMLGPFLWGKKAVTRLTSLENSSIEASVKGLSGVTHTRRFTFSYDEEICHDSGDIPSAYRQFHEIMEITDSFDHQCDWTAMFILAPGLKAIQIGSTVEIDDSISLITSSGTITIEDVEVSPAYGQLVTTCAIRISGNSRENCVTLQA